MNGIQQSDIFIKAALELGIEDLRKTPYLIDHMMGSLLQNKYVREKYGQKQVDACKEWFLNNNIEVSLKPRDDRDNPPCVTIVLGDSNEKSDMKTLGDQTPYSEMLLPNQIGKPIPFIVKPFIPDGYDPATGIVSTPKTVKLNIITPGMILVNPANGNGYTIQGVVPGGLQIDVGIDVEASELAIVPHYQFYKARVERIFNDESYEISCNAHGDPQNVIFLWNIVKYSLLRYRQSLLEANGMYESVLSSSGGPMANEIWTTAGGEKVYSRVFKLSCMTEDTWLKGPHRIIESISFSPVPAKNQCKGIEGGIKIISNDDTPSFMEDQLWTTVDESEETTNEDD